MPAESPGMEVVHLSGMTSFSSVQMADMHFVGTENIG